MLGGAALDNAGTVGGPGVDIGVSSGASGAVVFNHDGGRIEGNAWAVRLGGLGPRVQNSGVGSLITSAGIGIEFADDLGGARIWNLDGATIRGGKTAIRLLGGGTITNGAGSTIEATGTTAGDCGAGGSCSIYVSPGGVLTHNTILENAGTIIGNVQLDLDTRSRNEITLVAGGRIVGDLIVGNGMMTLVGEAGTTQRFSQAVTGTTTYAGGITKNGAGTWILDTPLPLGSALYENFPSLQVNGGTLQIGNGGTEGPRSLKDLYVYEGGRLVFDRSDDFVLNGSFAGGGTLTHTGRGLLTLSLKGAPSVGLLEIEAGSRMMVTGHTGGKVRNDGELTFKSPFSSPSDTFYWQGDISGTGSVIQAGAGHLTLAGMNTYTGTTVVNSGSLELRQGLTGDLRINPEGAFVAGTADLQHYVPRIGGTLYNAGRVVITQGDPIIWSSNAVPGDLLIGGDYVQASTGTFSVTLGDKLDITGTARLEGGTLEVRGAAVGYVANQRTDVLKAAGGVTGTFDRLVKGPGVVFTANTIHYDATSVWLDTRGLDVRQAAAGNGIGYTPVSMASAERVQAAFEQLNGRIAEGVPTGVSDEFLQSAGQFQRAPTIAAAQASLRSLSGQMHAASAAMAFRAIDAGGRALSDHFDDLRAGDAAVGMWTKRVGGTGGMARSGFDAVGFQHDGWLVGNDYRVGRSGVAGFAFGQGLGRQQLEHALDRDDSRRSESMLYAGVTQGKWYSQGRLGFGSYRQDISRQLLLGVAAEEVWTRYDGRYAMAHGESGFQLGRGDLRLVPFASLDYARSERDAFMEQGAGGFGLRSEAQAVDRWQAGLGMRASRRWTFGNDRTLDLRAHAQWRHTLASNGESMDASFVGLQQWLPVQGIGMSRHGYVFGLGMDARLSRRTTLDVSYDYEEGQYDSAQGLSAKVKFAF
jgi:fibronectin-binding autotransporter adhesin